MALACSPPPPLPFIAAPVRATACHMDRLETDAVADARGYVHVHVGKPGTLVHISIETKEALQVAHQIDCADRFAGRIWLTDDLLQELRDEGRP